jgi:hypothetical protein
MHIRFFTSFATVLALVLYALPTPSTAQATAAGGELTIAAKWKQGEQTRYAFTRSKVRAKSAPIEVKYNVVASVQAARANGYTVVLQIEGLALPDNFAELAQQRGTPASELLKVLPLELVIETDETGNIESLKNWQEIAQKMDAFVSLLMKSEKPEALEKMRGTLKVLYADEPTTRQTALRDLDILFAPLGDTLAPGKRLSADTKMNLPLLGELTAKETYLLTLDKPRAGVYLHEFTRVLDPASFAQAVERVVTKVAPDQARALRGSFGAMLVRDRNESEFDSQTGWLIRGQRIREAGLPDAAPLETTTLAVVRQ